MTYYAAALLAVYAVFRLTAPAKAQRALGQARTNDWVACGLGAGVIALAVAL